MAGVLYNLNDQESVKRWSKRLFRETIPSVMSMGWASESGSTPLYVQTDLNKGAGETINFFLRVKASGAGVKDDDELEGKEEGMTTHKDALNMHQLRHAFKSKGKLSEQRVNWKVRREIKDLGADWWSERLERWYFNLACGYNAAAADASGDNDASDDRYTGLHGVPTAPTSGNHFWSGTSNTADEDLASGDYLDLPDIDKAVNRAKIMSPQMRPIRTNAGEYYICVIHPNQSRFLRDTNSEWWAIMKSAMQGGAIANNPIFTGALGASNGCVFYESNYITNGLNSSTLAEITDVKRATVLGASAITMGFGQGFGPGQFDWAEVEKDYGNRLGVGIGLMASMKKPVFNSQDYGVIVLSSWAPDPS